MKYINGLKIATGTEDGRIIIYALRQTRPLVVKDHMYELPINEIHFNEGSDRQNFDRFYIHAIMCHVMILGQIIIG